jgi:hypothetical protein
LSRLRPQGRLLRLHHTRSDACGFVANRAPQTVDTEALHRARSRLSTGSPQEAPRCPQLSHTPVHCSATKHPGSLCRVKGVTPTRSVGLWGTWVKLGTALGRSPLGLCIGCAELSGVHRTTGLSTGSAHRPGGQKNGSDLHGWRYPPFPQALLLLPPRVTGKFASKKALCTTRARSAPHLLPRLDPDPHRLSVPYVRLVPGDTADDEGQQGRASNSRRRFR